MKYLHLGSPGREPRSGSSCLVAGWGLTEKKEDSDVLLSANVTVVDRKKCSKDYGSKVKITKEMICAGSKKEDTRQVGCVQHVSYLPQLCSCEPTCISVPHRATREGPSCAKGPWSGSLPLVVKVAQECTLTSLRNITPGSRRSSEPLNWRNELLLLSKTLTETQISVANGIKNSLFLSLQVCVASSGTRLKHLHCLWVCCCLIMRLCLWFLSVFLVKPHQQGVLSAAPTCSAMAFKIIRTEITLRSNWPQGFVLTYLLNKSLP